ncbi:MAG: signal peptidase I [Solirubrobacterales bacterium]
MIVLGSLCFWFAPSQFGGLTTYVVTHGTSMEPRFHTGDLALVRSQSSYRVGEIVAYDNRMLHTVVLHRIIGRHGSRYVFKGDNNNFVDPEHPKASQLVGALWLHIPGVGARLQSIRSPLLVGVLIAVGLLILTGSVYARRSRLRRRERRAEGGAHPPAAHLPRPSATPAAGIVAVGLLLLLPFIVLALVAFTKAPTARRSYAIPYKQSGALSYTAEAPPGPVYPEGRVQTGEPIFAHIVKAIDFSFAYRLHARGRQRLGGTVALDAEVASSVGWRTTIKLAPPTHFRGSRAAVSGTVNLTSLFALLHSVEKATGLSGGYTLTIVPKVTAAGTVDALPIHTNFTAKAAFTLTPSEIESATSSSGSPSTSTSVSAEERPVAKPLASSSSGMATGTHTVPETLKLGVTVLSVDTARKVALLAIAAILTVVLLLLLFLRSLQTLLRTTRQQDEAETIRSKFGRFIVPVERVWQLPGVPVIDVADIAALAQIAEHYDRSILEERSDQGVAFWVADESGQFRYALGAWASMADGEPVDQFADDTRVHEVYADEFELDGTIAAYGTLPAEETFPADAVTQGDWTPRRHTGRGRARKPRLV